MAQYKVPQDVEADDKLLGPFTFRQFVYLLIAAALIAVAVLLAQAFLLLALIPVPFILFFGALALPLKKDQPMETYLSALIDFYLKPRTRVWMPGQRETTISIAAPKREEDTRTRDISGEEATHRLSFLANIVDTEGYAIKGVTNSSMRDDLVAEANTANDMFDTTQFSNINYAINQDANARHAEAVEKMRAAIAQNQAFDSLDNQTINHRFDNLTPSASASSTSLAQPQVNPMNSYSPIATPLSSMTPQNLSTAAKSIFDSSVVVRPGTPDIGEIEAAKEPVSNHPQQHIVEATTSQLTEAMPAPEPPAAQPTSTPAPAPAPAPASTVQDADMVNLANNADYSVATIAKEANRIQNKGKEEGEVFISLH